MTTRRHIENTPDGFLDHLEEHHGSEKELLLAVWDVCGDLDPGTQPDAERKNEVRATVLAAASATDRNDQRVPVRRPLRRIPIQQYAVAASIAVLVAIGFIFSSDSTTYRAATGEQQTLAVNLPDGSEVVLASGSVLSYSESFGSTDRRLTLKGEAFFDVMSSSIPFQIDTYNSRTVVHGTRFSVRAWANDIEASTDVRVQEGLVSVGSKRTGGWTLLLEAGDQVSVPQSGHSAPALNAEIIEDAFSWLQGGYEYKNEPIGNVLADLKRQYAVAIKAPVSVKLRPISIFNQSQSSLEDVLGDISATVGINYRAISGGYELYEQ